MSGLCVWWKEVVIIHNTVCVCMCVCDTGRWWRPPAFQFPVSQTQTCRYFPPSRVTWQVSTGLTTGARKSLHQKMWDCLCVCTIMSTICHIKNLGGLCLNLAIGSKWIGGVREGAHLAKCQHQMPGSLISRVYLKRHMMSLLKIKSEFKKWSSPSQ